MTGLLLSSVSCGKKALIKSFLLALEDNYLLSSCFLFKYIEISFDVKENFVLTHMHTDFSNKFSSVGFFSAAVLCDLLGLCALSFIFIYLFGFFWGLVFMRFQRLLPCLHPGKDRAT